MGAPAPASTELSLLIVNYNSWRVCLGALRSFRACAPCGADGEPLPYDVVVVDNASPLRDPEAEELIEAELATMNGTLVRHHENGGYSTGMNLAYRHARGRLVLVSNPDIVYQPGAVDALLRYQDAHPEAGAVAPVGFWDEGMEGMLPPNILPTLADLVRLAIADVSPYWSRRYAAWRTRQALRVWLADTPIELDMLSGCCFVMRRELIERIGFFDERFPLYFEDTDLSVRIRKHGLAIVQIPDSRIVHLYNRSAQTNHGEAMARYWKGRRIYYRKWYGRLGALLYDATRWMLNTKWAQARAKLCPQREIRDLGTSNDKPVLRFDAPLARYLVEGALDAHFYLAAGIVGSGDSWTPTDSLFRGFGPTTYFWRVVDISDPRRPRLVAVYSHTLRYPTRQMVELGLGA